MSMIKNLESNISQAKSPGFALGLGLTNDCNLACAHCYRDVLRIDRLSLQQVRTVCEAIPVRSANLGTGENGLHPEFRPILAYLRSRQIKTSITSNGYSISILSDEELATLREVEVSIDFPTEVEQDAWRGAGNWKLVLEALERTRRLGIESSVIAVMMRTNYAQLALIAHIAAAYGANFRVNVYQPVKTDAYALTFDEFWTGWKLLLAETELIVCTEPIVNAVLGRQGAGCSSGCGTGTIRVTPRGQVLPCVYWPERSLKLADLVQQGAAIVEDAAFKKVLTVPDACRSCPFVDTCRGGCASRRRLRERLDQPDEYCPFVRGIQLDLAYRMAPQKEVLKSSSACTTVVRGDVKQTLL